MKKQDPAASFLTLTPAERFLPDKHGFMGNFYRPTQNGFQNKALVLFGGSDGSFSLTCLIAEQFVKRGLAVLALAYWRQPGLPDALARIPVEYVENAALWLKAHGYLQVGLWGISKGAEYALLSGSLLPELVSCVVAVSPINICAQGIYKGKTVRLLECSTWSFRGKEIPYARLQLRKGKIILDSLKRKSIRMRSCYDAASADACGEAAISVENINGPILLLSADDDDMWPARQASERIMRRLEEKRFSYEHLHLNYQYASHFLLPYPLKLVKMFAVERKYPEKCLESNRDAFEKTLAFLTRWHRQ